MPAFHYIAVAENGREKRGVIEAESLKQARQLLRQKSLAPLKVDPAQNKKFYKTRKFSLSSRALTSKELALMTRQFATLLSAGLPVEEGLFAVSEQTEKTRVKSLILSVRGKVVEGHSLAAALREHPDSFSDLYCATIAAGEKSGHLDKVLLRLAEYTEQQWRMRQKVTSALIYPSMIILVAFGIVSFLLAYVVPKMIAVYSNLHQDLPGITQLLITFSDLIKHGGIYFLGFIIVIALLLRRMVKASHKLREKMHYFMMRLPLFGYAMKTTNTARFSRTFSILAGSGVPVLEAMRIAAQLITTIPIRRAVEEAARRVREGAAIHLALKQTHYFSPMFVHMVASGEASGQLESMLERVALNQEDEILRLIEVSLALFEPAMILIMGTIVLFIVLAVLLPIFQLNQMTG